MAILKPQAFTREFPNLQLDIKTECYVCPAFVYNPTTGIVPKHEEFVALWDTGATGTVITKNVVDKLGLIPTGKELTYNANGEAIVNSYLIGIQLPNGVGISKLRVTEGILEGMDVLIGMDIISEGDLALTNKDGKTKFSFQMPSSHDIDFQKELYDASHTPIKKEKKPGRNDPCPCGNGKKYKNCHGQGL